MEEDQRVPKFSSDYDHELKKILHSVIRFKDFNIYKYVHRNTHILVVYKKLIRI